MKVLLFCAKGFETMEFSPFIDIFGWAKNDYQYDVEVVTCGFTNQVISTFGVPVVMDRTIDTIFTNKYTETMAIEDILIDEFDALAIPGGFEEYGFYEEAYDERLSALIRAFDQAKKPIASICVGALAIAKSGVLQGRKATTYHLRDGYRQKELASFGVCVVDEPIVTDDNIITSWCPQTAPYVAFALLERMIGKQKTHIVMEAMGYDDCK